MSGDDITLEALHNTVKHAQARHATVDIIADEGTPLVLRITDDGVGFDPAASRPATWASTPCANAPPPSAPPSRSPPARTRERPYR